jgi:hypothetical protein
LETASARRDSCVLLDYLFIYRRFLSLIDSEQLCFLTDSVESVKKKEKKESLNAFLLMYVSVEVGRRGRWSVGLERKQRQSLKKKKLAKRKTLPPAFVVVQR